MNVSFTGTRTGMTNAQKETFWALLQALGAKTFTHGNCYGADADAHEIAWRLGLLVYKRPSNILGTQAETVGGHVISEPLDPLKRNGHIVDDGEALIACPDSRQEKQRSGTWYTVRYAWKQKKMVYLIFPDGEISCGTSRESAKDIREQF